MSGSVLPGVSKWALSFGGEYAHDARIAGAAGQLFGAFDTSYRSDFSSSATASRYLVVDGYSLVNARVGFRWADNWSLTALGAQPARQELLRAADGRARQLRPLRGAGGRPAHPGRDHCASGSRTADPRRGSGPPEPRLSCRRSARFDPERERAHHTRDSHDQETDAGGRDGRGPARAGSGFRAVRDSDDFWRGARLVGGRHSGRHAARRQRRDIGVDRDRQR